MVQGGCVSANTMEDLSSVGWFGKATVPLMAARFNININWIRLTILCVVGSSVVHATLVSREPYAAVEK